MANLPADLRKLLEWLDRVSPLLEAQIVAAGFNQTLDKALMRNFAEMNLREATVSITARGRGALSKFPVMRRRPGPRTPSSRVISRASKPTIRLARSSMQYRTSTPLPSQSRGNSTRTSKAVAHSAGCTASRFW
jgi:hypothetical protein